MSFDWYAEYHIPGPDRSLDELDELDALCYKEGRFKEVEDVFSRIALLAGALHLNTDVEFQAFRNGRPRKGNNGRPVMRKIAPRTYAVTGHEDRCRPSSGLRFLMGQVDHDIGSNAKLLERVLGVPREPQFPESLRDHFWFLSIPLTLAKPYLSKDDRPFYILENPVRREKVFQVPMVSDTTWKGNLRWAMMKVRLEDLRDKLKPEDFARERLRQVLLFGTEEGSREREPVGFAKHLYGLNTQAADQYKKLLVEHFAPHPAGLIHHRGRLHFYPTFFNRIDMDIINPHDRRTGAGRDPVHMECVPGTPHGDDTASGTFRLLYFPVDLLGQDREEIRREAAADLRAVVEALKALMLTYGFSAKKSSGFGVIRSSLQGSCLVFCGHRKEFKSFDELETLVPVREKEQAPGAAEWS